MPRIEAVNVRDQTVLYRQPKEGESSNWSTEVVHAMWRAMPGTNRSYRIGSR
jgi:hypothetical protein